MKKFQILHQNRVQNIIQYHDNNIWKQMCIKNYLIVLRPIFDTTYKGKNRMKYKCELYIMNWSYSNKVGIVFAMYQIMISKGTSWTGPRLAAQYHQEMNGQVEVKWQTLQTIAHSIMVHARVSDEYIHFSLMYTPANILTVLQIKHLVNQDGEPTMPHKLATGTKTQF